MDNIMCMDLILISNQWWKSIVIMIILLSEQKINQQPLNNNLRTAKTVDDNIMFTRSSKIIHTEYYYKTLILQF